MLGSRDAVIGYGLQDRLGVGVGDTPRLEVGSGRLDVRIVGRYAESEDSGRARDDHADGPAPGGAAGRGGRVPRAGRRRDGPGARGACDPRGPPRGPRSRWRRPSSTCSTRSAPRSTC